MLASIPIIAITSGEKLGSDSCSKMARGGGGGNGRHHSGQKGVQKKSEHSVLFKYGKRVGG